MMTSFWDQKVKTQNRMKSLSVFENPRRLHILGMSPDLKYLQNKQNIASTKLLMIRPPDMHLGGLIFYHGFCLPPLLFLFVSDSPRSLNRTQPKPVRLHVRSLSVNSAFHFIATLRRRRSAYGTQPNFAKQWMVNSANKSALEKLESSLPKNWGLKMGQGVAKYERSPILSQSFMNFGPHADGLKPDRSYYQPSLFRFVPVHRTPSMRH